MTFRFIAIATIFEQLLVTFQKHSWQLTNPGGSCINAAGTGLHGVTFWSYTAGIVWHCFILHLLIRTHGAAEVISPGFFQFFQGASVILQIFFAVIFLQRYSLTDVSLAPDDPAFLWYNVICVLSSTAGVCGCLYQLVKRSPRCLGCVPTADNALLLLVQNNIIGCLATADLLAVVGTLNVVKLRRSVQNGLSTHGQGLGLVLVSYIGSIWITPFTCTVLLTFCVQVIVFDQ